jgi:hypothetical protein
MQKISFSGKMLFAGPLIKTSFEIPSAAVSQSEADKPVPVCTNGSYDISHIDTEISQEQDRQPAAAQYTGQDI